THYFSSSLSFNNCCSFCNRGSTTSSCSASFLSSSNVYVQPSPSNGAFLTASSSSENTRYGTASMIFSLIYGPRSMTSPSTGLISFSSSSSTIYREVVKTSTSLISNV